MSFYIRKALRVGPLRFNLSKSGIGVSAGFTGLRVGAGPRGNYVHMGRGGLYFRRSLGAAGGRSRAPSPVGGGHGAGADVAPGTVGPLAELESGSILEMTDATSEELLRELNEKRTRVRLLPFAVVLSLIALPIAVARLPGWAAGVAVATALALCWWARVADQLRRTTVILYDLEPEAERAYERLHAAFTEFRSCARTWHVQATGDVRDRKYHSGAGSVVSRRPVQVSVGAPPLVRTNVEVPLVPVGRQLLAFLPDRLLIFDAAAVGAVSYAVLALDVSERPFIEDGGVPADATVSGRTWRYVNKDGGPDRRFRDNPEIPICTYEELRFSSPTGLNEVLQASRTGVGSALRSAIASMVVPG